MLSVPNILVMPESDSNEDLTQCEFQHCVTCSCICFSTVLVSTDAGMLKKWFGCAYFLSLWLWSCRFCMLASYICQMLIAEPENIKNQKLAGLLPSYKWAFKCEVAVISSYDIYLTCAFVKEEEESPIKWPMSTGVPSTSREMLQMSVLHRMSSPFLF